eukprot:jgi/Tetstr1/461840/TSEL_006919.t1
MNLGADLFSLSDPRAHKYAKPLPKAASWKMADELLVAVLNAAKMAKELRKSRGEELFAVAVREVFDAVAELRTDQSTEWTEELKESLMEFADIIA